ncbi:MAG: LEA type 2 family protein, partial [Treponema sp.]|nr:LEA type 2 family protein [Treponema sp.]
SGAAIAFTFILWGCQSYDTEVIEPHVSIHSVDVARINFSDVDLIVNVDIQNPNRFTIPLPNIDWELFIDTANADVAPFMQGNFPDGKSLAGRKKTTLPVPVHLTFEDVYDAFASLVYAGEVVYNIALDVSFLLPIIGEKVFNLDVSGELSLPQIPEVSFNQMNISRLDFQGTDVLLDVNVTNTNSFPIAFPDINWNYIVNGVPVIASSFSGAGQGNIAAGATAHANIAITLTHANIAKAGSAIHASGEVPGSFSLGVNLAETGLPAAVQAAAATRSVLTVPAAVPMLQLPEISFGGITRRALGLMRLEFSLSITVENRNSFAFDIDELNYEVRVNGHLWLESSADEPLRVAANSKLVIPMNVVITTPVMVEELVTALSRGSTVSYALTGNMNLQPEESLGLEKIDVPLNIRGSSRIL